MKATTRSHANGVSILLLSLTAASVLGQSTDREAWDKLNGEVGRLYGAGKYAEGSFVAERALALAERTFGADHADTATSVNRLALLYHSQGLAVCEGAAVACPRTVE